MTRALKILLGTGVLILFLIGCKSDMNTSQIGGGQPANTIDILTERIEKNPNDAELYFNRSKDYYETKSYNEAIADLQKAISLDKTKPLYYQAMADAYMDSYQSKKALDILEEAVNVIPNDMTTRLKRINYLLIYKQYKQAILGAREALKLDPQNEEVYLLVGMVYKETNNDSLAISSFQRAVDLNPDMVDAYMNLGELYEKKNDPIALMYYDNAIKAEPNSPMPKHAKAYYLQNNKKVSEAVAIYKDILTEFTNYVPAYLNMGVLYFRMDSLPAAYNQFNKMISVDNSVAEGYYYRGLVATKMGLTQKAIDDLQQALIINPELEEAQKGLDELLKQ